MKQIPYHQLRAPSNYIHTCEDIERQNEEFPAARLPSANSELRGARRSLEDGCPAVQASEGIVQPLGTAMSTPGTAWRYSNGKQCFDRSMPHHNKHNCFYHMPLCRFGCHTWHFALGSSLHRCARVVNLHRLQGVYRDFVCTYVSILMFSPCVSICASNALVNLSTFSSHLI